MAAGQQRQWSVLDFFVIQAKQAARWDKLVLLSIFGRFLKIRRVLGSALRPIDCN